MLYIDDVLVEANLPAITNGTSLSEHGYITIDKTCADYEEPVTVTVKPDDGYQLKSLTVTSTYDEGDPITPTQDAQDETEYTFEALGYAVTVTATFEMPAIEVTTWTALQEAIDATAGDATTPATATTTLILANDLTPPEQDGASITIPEGKDITLDLNGKVINANGGAFNVITVEEGGTLTLTDSAPTTEHYFTVDADGLWTLTDTKTETTKTVTGGVITGGTGMDCGPGMGTNGGGVYVCSTLNMKAGNIVGNEVTPSEDESANGLGGGVNVYEGTFTMSGGTVTGNTADAGGVCVYDGTFTMSGGAISNNIAYFGGGVIFGLKVTLRTQLT